MAGGADGLSAYLGNDATARLVWSRIRMHGIALALLEMAPAVHAWPRSILSSLRDEARLQALWELSHRNCLLAVLARLDAAGVECLVLKGTALAYLVYDQPAMRRRGDSDILVRESSLPATRAILADMGLVRTQDATFGQESWVYDTGIGFVHCIDLHWEVVAAPFLRQLLDVEECFASATPLPRLAAGARTTSPALLFMRGLVNQALHRTNGYLVDDQMMFADGRLIWLLDAHLLALRNTPADWEQIARIGVERGLAPICAKMLRHAQKALGTPLPESVMTRLEAEPQANPVTSYLELGSGTARLRDDLGASRDMASRVRLLLAHAFPPRNFMQGRYPGRAHWPLGLLYLHRLVAGLWNLLVQQGKAG
ncbi:nucleotidyltransferase family protein [Alteraurantiacibacter palmitatis]|uniref:Nucleotidyltransferase family protein n=1 Tax=Alteraurantiacibacter palmitatis TaxID=2054628 RepID=A0ABV7E8U2_9SPHN